jgi:hypothetical protein
MGFGGGRETFASGDRVGVFSRIFRLGSTKPSAPAGACTPQAHGELEARAGGHSNRYDLQLIDLMRDDHRTLLYIYSDLVRATERDDFATVRRLLVNFKFALQAHLRVENMRSYAQLQRPDAADASTSVFLADLRSEMDCIAHAAVKFANTYARIEKYTPEKKADFSAKLASIGDVLVKQVSLEDSRPYTLFQPG